MQSCFAVERGRVSSPRFGWCRGRGYAGLVLPSRFPYQDVVAELRSSIQAGRLAPGQRLPSENELAERYETSRPTVRRAIALLKAEGLVSTEQGRGAFVRPKPHVRLVLSGENFRRHRRAGVSGFGAQVREQGQSPEQRILEAGWAAAPRGGRAAPGDR